MRSFIFYTNDVHGGVYPMTHPAWQTVYKYFRFWQKLGIWENINLGLQKLVRVQAGEQEYLTVAIADSQSVKTTEKREPARAVRCAPWCVVSDASFLSRVPRRA